jgi:type VI secretion system protein ImpH
MDLVVGSRVWDVQSKFRLRIGPLSWREFQALMPNATALRPLCQFTRTYVGPELDFDIQPVLKRDEVPPTQLSPDTEDGPFLGWNTWMPSESRDRDVDDAVFVLEEI